MIWFVRNICHTVRNRLMFLGLTDFHFSTFYPVRIKYGLKLCFETISDNSLFLLFCNSHHFAEVLRGKC